MRTSTVSRRHTTTKTSGKVLASVALVAAAAGVAGLGTYGSFTSTTSASARRFERREREDRPQCPRVRCRRSRQPPVGDRGRTRARRHLRGSVTVTNSGTRTSGRSP